MQTARAPVEKWLKGRDPWLWLALFAALPWVSTCGGSALEGRSGTSSSSIELGPLEIRDSGVDRFVSCPPPGEIGQAWIPPIPPYQYAARDQQMDGPTQWADYSGSSAVERAMTDTHTPFRRCFIRGLIHDPTQDGHAAIVLRVGANGRVAQTESYAACDLSEEVIECMMHEASRLRFHPPGPEGQTIVIPATFARRSGFSSRSPSSNDTYTASAYVTVEAARPEFHRCARRARREAKPVEASATFALELNDAGKVTRQNIEPWTGSKELLACAANAVNSLTFAPPPGGKGKVLLKLAFNPRSSRG